MPKLDKKNKAQLHNWAFFVLKMLNFLEKFGNVNFFH